MEGELGPMKLTNSALSLALCLGKLQIDDSTLVEREHLIEVVRCIAKARHGKVHSSRKLGAL
jgi:hypothetical protein